MPALPVQSVWAHRALPGSATAWATEELQDTVQLIAEQNKGGLQQVYRGIRFMGTGTRRGAQKQGTGELEPAFADQPQPGH